MRSSACSCRGVLNSGGIPFDLRLTPEQAQATRKRRQTNRQATLEAREIARNGGPAHASAQATLDALKKGTA